MKRPLPLLGCMAALLLAACTSEEPQVLPENCITKEKFDSRIVNRLWQTVDEEWKDDDGNIMPDPNKYMVGLGGCAYFYFHDSGMISFSTSTHLSRSHNGTFVFKDGTTIMSDNELLSIGEDELYMRTDRGMWCDDPAINPDAQRRDDVCRYYTLKEVKEPDWAAILSAFRPIGYNPEDFGMK